MEVALPLNLQNRTLDVKAAPLRQPRLDDMEEAITSIVEEYVGGLTKVGIVR